MQAPFRQRFEPVHGPHEARFHATALKLDLAMGVTFGRSMAGFIGMGTVEIVPAGVRIVARRYRYGLHVAVAVVACVAATVAVSAAATAGKTDPHEIDLAYRGAAFWGVMSAILGASIASWSARFFAPVTALVDRTRIQHVQMLGPRLRVFSNEGDVELWLPRREDLQAVVQALAAGGIPMR